MVTSCVCDTTHVCAGGKLGLAMSSMAALAATSAVVDLSDHKLTGQGFEDSVTPVRRVFPYEQ